MLDALTTGFTLSLTLILAIGAQNAFVLRQGLRLEHIFLVCLTCALSDALLISLGVAGFGVLTARYPWIAPLMRYAGCAFLLWYGAKSFHAAWRSNASLLPQDSAPAPAAKILLTALALTWLNPHVYLDTLLLIGSLSTPFKDERLPFALGAISASFLFFFALGYGARLLRPFFAKPASWHILETLIGLTMWTIAGRLLAL